MHTKNPEKKNHRHATAACMGSRKKSCTLRIGIYTIAERSAAVMGRQYLQMEARFSKTLASTVDQLEEARFQSLKLASEKSEVEGMYFMESCDECITLCLCCLSSSIRVYLYVGVHGCRRMSMYACIFVYICMYVYIYIHIYIYMYTYICINTYRDFVRIYAYPYVCVVCIVVCLYIYIYVWIDVDMYLCPHMLVCIGECMYIYICI